MKIKNLFNNENRTKLIGLFTILLSLWLVLYFIPEVFLSLFDTLLGNLILIIVTLLFYMNNRIYGLTFGLVALILYRVYRLSKEGFSVNVSGTFNIDEKQEGKEESLQELQQHFLQIQSTINRNKVFDMNVIESQTSKKELEYFNKTGKWPWSQDVINLFEEAISRNPYIRTVPEEATNYARTIYNEKAILRILSYQTKEGQFLINGILVKDPSGNKMEELPSGFGNFPYEVGLLDDRRDDIIKCNMKNENNPTLERISYSGKGGIFGEQIENKTPVDYNKLEEIIPGFTFLNKPCNPCGALAPIPDYSCAYRLKVKDKPPFISNVWQYLWNINDNPLESQPSFLSEFINPNKFPLLSELQTELKKNKKPKFNYI